MEIGYACSTKARPLAASERIFASSLENIGSCAQAAGPLQMMEEDTYIHLMDHIAICGWLVAVFDGSSCSGACTHGRERFAH